MRKCKVKGCDRKHKAKGLCSSHYNKKYFSSIPRFGKNHPLQHSFVFTNGVTEEIKPLIPKIKNAVLNDCIQNPAKYLYDGEDEKANKRKKEYLGERTKSSIK